MSGRLPRIWVLLGARVGDNNQLLALAEALGLPFETRSLTYRSRWALLLRLFPVWPLLLDRASRARLAPPWPDLTIGIGRRSVAVARWIRRRTGGRTKVVRLGNPRADPRMFDLVITTQQYPVPPAANVLSLPVAMGRHSKRPEPTAEETDWLGDLPRPHLLLSLGGVTRYWQFPTELLADTASRLADRADAASGSLIVVSSPRTPEQAIGAIRTALDGRRNCRFVTDGRVRFPVLLGDADEHFVTADSVSMISEAVLTGKPVGLVAVELDDEGRRELGARGFADSIRDIRRFWADLKSRGLVGTVDRPVNGSVEDPVELAAAAVRRLLGDRVE